MADEGKTRWEQTTIKSKRRRRVKCTYSLGRDFDDATRVNHVSRLPKEESVIGPRCGRESPPPAPPPYPGLATLHALPISERPRRTWTRCLSMLAFGIAVNLGCVLVNASQFVLLPLLPLHLG